MGARKPDCARCERLCVLVYALVVVVVLLLVLLRAAVSTRDLARTSW